MGGKGGGRGGVEGGGWKGVEGVEHMGHAPRNLDIIADCEGGIEREREKREREREKREERRER